MYKILIFTLIFLTISIKINAYGLSTRFKNKIRNRKNKDSEDAASINVFDQFYVPTQVEMEQMGCKPDELIHAIPRISRCMRKSIPDDNRISLLLQNVSELFTHGFPPITSQDMERVKLVVLNFHEIANISVRVSEDGNRMRGDICNILQSTVTCVLQQTEGCYRFFNHVLGQYTQVVENLTSKFGIEIVPSDVTSQFTIIKLAQMLIKTSCLFCSNDHEALNDVIQFFANPKEEEIRNVTVSVGKECGLKPRIPNTPPRALIKIIKDTCYIKQTSQCVLNGLYQGLINPNSDFPTKLNDLLYANTFKFFHCDATEPPEALCKSSGVRQIAAGLSDEAISSLGVTPVELLELGNSVAGKLGDSYSVGSANGFGQMSGMGVLLSIVVMLMRQ